MNECQLNIHSGSHWCTDVWGFLFNLSEYAYVCILRVIMPIFLQFLLRKCVIIMRSEKANILGFYFVLLHQITKAETVGPNNKLPAQKSCPLKTVYIKRKAEAITEQCRKKFRKERPQTAVQQDPTTNCLHRKDTLWKRRSRTAVAQKLCHVCLINKVFSMLQKLITTEGKN